MNPITQIALAGTSKVTAEPTTGTPLDAVVSGLPGVERERALLLHAAADVTYRTAGLVALPGVSLADPAPDEQLRVCSQRVAVLVGDMLQGQHSELLPEALRLLARARLRLPHALLPSALSHNTHELRPALRPVLGERGRWLGRLNLAWSWAIADGVEVGADVPANAETTWQEGNPAERLAILERVRDLQPELARAWIEAAWREEKADFRNQTLDVLEHGLSGDDEPLLEKALDDRAPTVRARAATLLATIPHSALVQRMQARADALLRYARPAPVGGLRGLIRSALSSGSAVGTLAVTLPETFDKSWQRDGIVEKAPPGLGQRSWWLGQILALVPPRHWEQQLGAGPADLIAAATADDSGLAVLEGWSRAAVVNRAADWAMPLWHAWEKSNPSDRYYPSVRQELLGALAALIPADEAERLAHQMLTRKDSTGHIRGTILRALPTPWSASFGNAVLDIVHRNRGDAGGYGWADVFPIAATALPPACLERALKLFAPTDDQHIVWYTRSFLTTIEIRQRLYQEIQP